MPIVPTAINGKVPEALLRTLPGRNGDGTPHRADLLAATSYPRLRDAFQRAGLGDLLPTDGYSCYRTIADQQRMLAHGLTSVPAGKSIHGEAKAVDFQGMTGSRLAWMRANAAPFGWYQPAWAINGIGAQAPEPWHWEYDAALDNALPDPAPPQPPSPTPPKGDADVKLFLMCVETVPGARPYYLANYGAGTATRIWNGAQIDILRMDPEHVTEIGGLQASQVIQGLRILGEG